MSSIFTIAIFKSTGLEKDTFLHKIKYFISFNNGLSSNLIKFVTSLDNAIVISNVVYDCQNNNVIVVFSKI
jgi:hypothetical protein